MGQVAIIIPTYNERPEVLSQTIENLLPLRHQLVIVDDGSTKTNVHNCLAHYGVHIVTHLFNLGQGAALQTGFEYATRILDVDYVITFDADGQHSVNDIAFLLSPLEDREVDVTLGSRFLQAGHHNASAFRRFLFFIARQINYLFIRHAYTDTHNGLRGLSRKALNHIYITENRMAHATEILMQIKEHGLRYKEVPVRVSYTNYSRKKGQTFLGSFNILVDLILHKIFR